MTDHTYFRLVTIRLRGRGISTRLKEKETSEKENLGGFNILSVLRQT